MSITKTYLQTSLHYGAYYGLASFAFSMLLYYTIGNPIGALSWLGVWIPIVFICVAIKNHRNEHLGGYITYWEAFRAGFFTIVFGGALYAVFIYLFGISIAQQMVSDYKTEVMQQTESVRQLQLFDEKVIDTMIEGIEKTTMGSWASGDYMNKVLGAALVSLIAAAVYKKTKMPTDVIN
ncbi:MAG: DUF4199 domain-containing protein [Bacteroidia bacterium]